MSRPSLSSSRPHLIAALVTPFTPEGTIDRASLGKLVTYLRQAGVDEYFVAGSTGEAPLLDDADRLAIIETVRAAAPRGLVYAGISGMGRRHAVRNACEAARAGADVAVVMSPYFVALDQPQLEAYTVAIADACPVPLALYHHLRMPTPFAVPTIARLSAHPNIFAIKDTNGSDHNRCAEILAATAGQSFKFLQGVEKLVQPTLAAGGHGCVVAQGCIAPHLFRRLFTAWEAGDVALAAELQSLVDALWAIFLRREVKQSFSHFLHTLKLPLHRHGVLATTAGALPGAVFGAEFEQMIDEFMQKHLDAAPALRTP